MRKIKGKKKHIPNKRTKECNAARKIERKQERE